MDWRWNQWLLKNTKEEDVSFWNAILALHCGLLDTSFYHPGWVDRGNKALAGGMCVCFGKTDKAHGVADMISRHAITGMNRPARLEKYAEEFTRVATKLYDSWSTKPHIPLFISGSDLLLHANI